MAVILFQEPAFGRGMSITSAKNGILLGLACAAIVISTSAAAEKIVEVKFAGLITAGIWSDHDETTSLGGETIAGTLTYTITGAPADSDPSPTGDLRTRYTSGTADDSGGWRIETDIQIGGRSVPTPNYSLYPIDPVHAFAQSLINKSIGDGSLGPGDYLQLSRWVNASPMSGHGHFDFSVMLNTPANAGVIPLIDFDLPFEINGFDIGFAGGEIDSESVLEGFEVEAVFDLTKLSATVVPIPVSALLMASGLAVLVRRRPSRPQSYLRD